MVWLISALFRSFTTVFQTCKEAKRKLTLVSKKLEKAALDSIYMKENKGPR